MNRIIIIGNPISKKRPRFANRGKYVAAINDQQTEEGKFWLEARSQWQKEPLKGGIEVRMFFFMKRPKNHYGTGKNKGILKKTAPLFHTSKPDIDNLEKMVYDCLSQLVWLDDSLIVSSTAIKVYSDNPRTEIVVMEVDDKWEEETRKLLMTL